jgi:hypothetical protein
MAAAEFPVILMGMNVFISNLDERLSFAQALTICEDVAPGL